jgi:hypothetical protein
MVKVVLEFEDGIEADELWNLLHQSARLEGQKNNREGVRILIKAANQMAKQRSEQEADKC